MTLQRLVYRSTAHDVTGSEFRRIVAVSERDRETEDHGLQPALLRCEFEAVGYEQVAFQDIGPQNGYVARFRPSQLRPEPNRIKPCKG
jgi:hypothetical protein